MSNNEEQVYAAPEADLHDNNNEGASIDHLAGRGTRLGAVILDTLILIIFALGPGMILMYLMGSFSVEDEAALTLNIYLYSSPFLLIFFAINCVLLYKYGQTIAKRLLKIKIVRSDGTRIAFGRLLGLRIILVQLLYQIPIAGSIFSLVDALFIFREDRKCIHDLIADTKVVDVDFELTEVVEEA